MSDFLRRLPHNIEAEIAVLGGILLDDGRCISKLDGLQPDDFLLAKHSAIFARMLEMRGGIINPITLKGWAESPELEGTLLAEGEAPGGADYLLWLVPTAPLPPSPSQITPRSSAMPPASGSCEAITTGGYNCAPPDETAALAETLLREFRARRCAAAGMRLMPSRDAVGRVYQEPEQFVEGFLTVGLTLLSASPKAGKSWLLHEFAIGSATASNALGKLPCLQSEVLCLFLEDSERRGILRERTLMGHAGGVPGLTYAWVGSQWNLNRLARWCDKHPACRFVAIDTAERWKQMQQTENTGRVYADDYRFWGELQSFAISREIALALLHHDRKPNGAAGNVIDSVSGTRGVTGPADHLLMLDRNRDTGISTLRVVGRELAEKSLQFTRGADGRLRAIETPVLDAVARIEQRAKARAMRDDGASFSAIAKALGISKSTASEWCSGQ